MHTPEAMSTELSLVIPMDPAGVGVIDVGATVEKVGMVAVFVEVRRLSEATLARYSLVAGRAVVCIAGGLISKSCDTGRWVAGRWAGGRWVVGGSVEGRRVVDG